MKKVKIISVVAAVVVLLLLNSSIIISNGKAETMPVTVNTELASDGGQCWLSFSTWSCSCPVVKDMACVAICYGPGITCGEIIVDQ
ncbi:MAG: hypothetical protein ACUVTX_00335 [Bacteroidales bacterium]